MLAPADAGVPAADEEAGLIGVEVPEGDGPGFVPISTSFLSGEPEGDLLTAATAALDTGEEALE